mgnify:CR=1 FL=1
MNKSKSISNTNKKLKAVSLFAGAGGMDVGFTNAGYDVVWANELMKHAAATYRTNHPRAYLAEGSITDYVDNLPTQDIHCVFGGPPCQGFSVAGKMDPNDPRSKLVFEFMNVVEKISPQIFVMENVKALAKLDKFEKIRIELLKKAISLGYTADFHLLNAKDFGVPQSRERVFFIGFKRELKKKMTRFHFKRYELAPSPMRSIFEILGPAGTEINPLTCKAKITLAANPILRRSPYAGMLFNGMGRPINMSAVSATLPASMGGNKTPIVDELMLINPSENWVENYHSAILEKKIIPKFASAPAHLRRLTIKEAALIQTFPKDYVFEGPYSAQYSQIGNAVPCMLAEAVARAVLDVMSGFDQYTEEAQKELDLQI